MKNWLKFLLPAFLALATPAKAETTSSEPGPKKLEHVIEEERKSKNYGINFYVPLGIDFAELDFIPRPYSNWEENYQPWNGGPLSTYRSSSHLIAGLEIEPNVNNNKFSYGIPIYYHIPLTSLTATWDGFTLDQTVGGINVRWWNEVPLNRVYLRKTTPGIGLSIQQDFTHKEAIPGTELSIKHHKFIKFQGAIQQYILISKDYAGKDIYGAPNSAYVINKKVIEKGLGYRLEVQYLNEDLGCLGLGSWVFYYERNGNEVDNHFGLSVDLFLGKIGKSN